MVLMPEAGDILIREKACEVEKEKLYLPSDFSPLEREVIGVTMLGCEEVKLREGEAFDALHATRSAVKAVIALKDRKRRDARGQAENTRSGRFIRDAEARRDRHMQTYAAARDAMCSLGLINADGINSPFPPLTLADTFMKSRQRKRGVGDSHRTDGALWRMGRITVPSSSSIEPVIVDGGQMDAEGEGAKIGVCV
jgi:hypothetical protein